MGRLELAVKLFHSPLLNWWFRWHSAVASSLRYSSCWTSGVTSTWWWMPAECCRPADLWDESIFHMNSISFEDISDSRDARVAQLVRAGPWPEGIIGRVQQNIWTIKGKSMQNASRYIEQEKTHIHNQQWGRIPIWIIQFFTNQLHFLLWFLVWSETILDLQHKSNRK